MARGTTPLRRKASRLGWATALLAGVAVALVLGGVLLLVHSSDRVTWDPLLPLGLVDVVPGTRIALAALFGLLALLAGIAALHTSAQMRLLSQTRRSAGPDGATADPGVALPSVEEVAAVDRVRLTVLIPAHDEEAVLGLTLDSLAAQTRPPDRVVVVADNCTDRTAEIARGRGLEVFETAGNTEKKAGALNQALATILPTASAADVVLVMDADSTIDVEYLAVALGLLEDDPALMAISGLFYGEEGAGLVGQLQRNEYTRYQRVVARRPERVFVLTGTASIIRAYAMTAVAASRGSMVPGPPGKVYDTLAMTEDNELTLALRTLGAKMYAPPQCVVTTEVMSTWRDLWRQRLRWHRGALENIGVYGMTRASALYWRQQAGLAYGVAAFLAYLTLFVVTLLSVESMRWSVFWVVIGLVFVVERLVTVWPAGWRARLLAAPMVIELGYALFLQVCFLASLVEIGRRTEADWNYVPRPAAPPALVPAVLAFGVVLPESVLHTGWYAALAAWVAFNTLVYAALCLGSLFPPLPRRATRDARGAIARVVS